MAKVQSGKSMTEAELRILGELEKKVLWLSSWTIHHANHIRESTDGLKVGGHQASSASLAAIMTALYFHALRPQDRVAVKPHASPNFHAIQYLLGKQTREKLEAFRGYKGAQSYPSRTKDTDDVDFSTGSVGLGVAQTLFSSLVQDYVRSHFPTEKPEGRMIALVGDAEMDEGNIFEAMLEGWKQGLRNCWWVIDYNRQSLDAVIREGLWARYEALFKAFGWDVVIVKHGSLQEAAFKRAGRRSAAHLDQQLPEPALLGADVPGRRRLAQAADERPRRSGAGEQAARQALRRRACEADGQSRRTRPAVAGRGVRQGCARTTGRPASSATRSRARASHSPDTRTITPA